MGKVNTDNTIKPGGTPKQTRSRKPRNTNSNNTPTTETRDTTSTTRSDTSTTDPNGEENQISPGLVILEPPPGSEPKQKKARPSGMKYNTKSKSPNPSKGGASTDGTVIMVQSVIQGLFMVAAGRVGEHWALTDEEANAIAEPSANIIAKYVDTDKLAKYSDPAALVFALGAVMLPRVMIQVQSAKKEVTKNEWNANTELDIRSNRPTQPDTSGARGTGSGIDGESDITEPTGDAEDDDRPDIEKLLRDAEFSPY
jgi:hypothetical protein